MKKANFEKNLKTILIEAQKFKEKSELEKVRASFLGKEADNLMAKYNNETSPDKREEIGKQMIALQGRIEHEVRLFEKGVLELKSIESRLDELVLTYNVGLIKEN